jgi:hypothetical protein
MSAPAIDIEVRRAIAAYLRSHPDQSFATVSLAFGYSRSTVGNIAREFGIHHVRKVGREPRKPYVPVVRSDRRIGEFLRFLATPDAVRLGARLREVDARLHEHFARAYIKCPHNNGQEGANHDHE